MKDFFKWAKKNNLSVNYGHLYDKLTIEGFLRKETWISFNGKGKDADKITEQIKEIIEVIK